MSDLTKLAQDCGATSYRNRITPHSPALAFGDEAWAKFCEAVSAQPAQAVPVLTDEEIQAVWVEHGLDDCAVEEFARAIEQAVRAKMGASNLVESHQIKPVEIDGIKPGIVGKEGA